MEQQRSEIATQAHPQISLVQLRAIHILSLYIVLPWFACNSKHPLGGANVAGKKSKHSRLAACNEDEISCASVTQ